MRIQNPNARENDFIEIELDRQELTYRSLLRVCCRELDISAEHVEKIRKLPNTMLRKVRKKNLYMKRAIVQTVFPKPPLIMDYDINKILVSAISDSSGFLCRTRMWHDCRTFRSWRWCWRRQRVCLSSLGLGALQTDHATT